MTVVDAHVHLLPPRLAAKVRAFFDMHVPDALAYPNDPDAVLRDLDREGVEQAWVLPYAHVPGVAAWMVPATAAHVDDLAARGHGVELVLGTTTHPGDPTAATDVEHAVRDLGARVLKLHCGVGRYAVDDPRLDPVWRVCAELALPVVVHAGTDVAGHSDAVDVAAIDHVATRHPDVSLVVAHAGLPAVAGILALLDRHGNLHADLTPVVEQVPFLRDHDLVRHADRLLFGSDAPNTGHSIGSLLTRVTSRQLGAQVTDAILGGNARRLTDGVRVGS